MIDHAQLRWLLTQQHLRDALPETDAHVIVVDTDSLDLDAAATSNPRRAERRQPRLHDLHVRLDRPPQGALNTHRAITNRILWMQHAALGADDTVLQKTRSASTSRSGNSSGRSSPVRASCSPARRPARDRLPVEHRARTDHHDPFRAVDAACVPRSSRPRLALRIAAPRRMQRRSVARPAAALPRASGRQAVQPLWPDRGRRRRDRVGMPPRRSAPHRPDRPADRQHPPLHRRCADAAHAGRRAGC